MEFIAKLGEMALEGAKNLGAEIGAEVASMARVGVEGLGDGLRRFGSEVWEEVEHQVAHGASELASGLVNGQAFVLYGHGRQGNDDGPAKEAEPQIEMERGGMEM
jgi:hypothetical protein